MKKMTTAQLNRLNKSTSTEEKMYKAWKKSQKALEKARKKF